MKRMFLICLLLLPFFANAQQKGQHITYITRDSLKGLDNLTENWRFRLGDSASMADPGYDDSQWKIVNPAMYIPYSPPKEFEQFNSIGWFRLHFIADSSVTELPICLLMSHYGASEIFLDGTKIDSFGKIKGKDNSEYYDPQYLGFSIVLHKAGEHVIAVRYANYNATRNNNIYHRGFAGFHLKMSEANRLVYWERYKTLANSTVLMFLFGLFTGLGLLHLFLYFYYRAAKSNLYFSIFTFSLAIIFLLSFLNWFATNPNIQLRNVFFSLVVSSAACYSFSGFSNELFSTKRLRFRIIVGLCILAPLIFIFNPFTGASAFVLLIGIVTIESIILTVRAIYKKVKGARIVGFGILLFALFFLSIAVTALIFGSADLDDSTPTGQIFSIFAALAILSVPISISAYLAWSFSAINKDLKVQLEHVQLLSEKNLEQEKEKKRWLEDRKDELEREVAKRTEEIIEQKEKIEKQHDDLKKEKRKSDDLLLNILPAEVAEELKDKGTSEAKFFDHVTVLFTDFVDFTKAGERMGAQALVDELHACFKAFDEIISKYNIEKIKTIGDAYLAVCGLPVADENHATNVAMAAIDIRQYIMQRKMELGDQTFDIRIGVHSGSVVAGIVGVKKFAYDIWGDTVNTAARMEQHSETGKINISEITYGLVKDKFVCTYRGKISAKNKGDMNMYFVEKAIES